MDPHYAHTHTYTPHTYMYHTHIHNTHTQSARIKPELGLPRTRKGRIGCRQEKGGHSYSHLREGVRVGQVGKMPRARGVDLDFKESLTIGL